MSCTTVETIDIGSAVRATLTGNSETRVAFVQDTEQSLRISDLAGRVRVVRFQIQVADARSGSREHESAEGYK